VYIIGIKRKRETSRREQNMKYGIYEAKDSNCTTYWTFNLKDNEEAEKMGYKKIGETRTKAEAYKAVDKMYKTACR